MKALKWWIIIFVVLGTAIYFLNRNQNKVEHLNYSQFIEMVEGSKITEVALGKGNEVIGKTIDGKNFDVCLPVGVLNDSRLIDKLTAKNVKIIAKSLDLGGLFGNLIFFLIFPVLLIGGLMFLFKNISKQQDSLMNKMDGRTKSLSKLSVSEKTTFKDVAGIDEAKAELEETIEFLKNPQKFTKLGAKIPRGILLAGPPGCGKTLLAKAVAGEAGANFFSVSGSSFVEVFVGVGAARVRDAFAQAKAKSPDPSIIFIDEIDAIGRQRGTGVGGGNDEREQTLNEIFVNMDGFSKDENIIIIAATNRPDILDEALIRPGRFDRHVIVPLPDVVGRQEILKVHTKNILLDEQIDLEKIAKLTPGFSGAALANLVNEAAIFAAKDGCEAVKMEHLDKSRDKILMGPARKTAIDDQDKKAIAYHEAGHTLVAKLIPGTDPVEKVSIIPRGMALGVTMQMPEKDRFIKTKSYLMSELAILLGGRVAEEIRFGVENISSGASNDLERVTDLAEKMIRQWGMGASNFRTFGEVSGAPFLGLEMTKNRHISEKTAEKVDNEVSDLIRQAYERAKKILTQNSSKLSNLAQELFEKETLSAEEIDHIVKVKS